MNADTFSGMAFRSIGPAANSGRIADFAVNPGNVSEYYVAVAAGNVWKTVNAGVTWTPLFDNYGSWSTADVEMDPNNSKVIWLGTGEYNSQRAIGYGDGVYRSEDGGKTWENMGLKASEHIGRIIIDPRNSHVYVAAQGPLWGPGGECGVYKTTDNGKTWKKILEISENTGVTDIVLDPRCPDILYAASYQRRRHVFTLINGGPESAVYKSTDAGATWKKLGGGLPAGDVGRIGLTISPANPDIVYAIVEASEEKGGFFCSRDRGASWEKRSNYVCSSPQYYQRIVADPKNPEKVYVLDTISKVSEDGGKTWTRLNNDNRHVDDHVIWINPADTQHLRIGGDGGVYESWDGGQKWQFKGNLPVTQFYRVTVDDSLPFYYVYGGTQDNASLGGPSRTINQTGIVNSDWFITNGGDGFESEVEPGNPDIIYAQSQHGFLVRYDKKSGEALPVQPQEGKNEAYRWNWNSPLIISPHSPTRLYFAANKLFRSDDRGHSWKAVSPDLTRQLDRNLLKVMGKIQHPEVPSKNASTSLYGNITALDESPLAEGLLYVGTDDGLIQISEDAGKNWRRIESVPGVPNMTYVCFLYASRHDKDTVYAAFDRRKDNDLKPYLMKSDNRGKTWVSMNSGLPERGGVYCIAQDHVNKNLLFIGTEFGVYFSVSHGQKWVQLKGGIPVNMVPDMDIQTRENDLAAATFGRGFYILDNYAPLREVTSALLEKDFHLFPVRDALLYIPRSGSFEAGDDFYKAANPEFGATFTWYMKEPLKTLKQKRKDEEKKATDKGLDIRYPGFAELRAEDLEPKPYLLFTIRDESGAVARRLRAPAVSGMQRITWNLRFPSLQPLEKIGDLFDNKSSGVFVMPGTYTVSVEQCLNGQLTPLEGRQTFTITLLKNTTLPAEDRKALAAFQAKTAELLRVVRGAVNATEELEIRLKLIREALHFTPDAPPDLAKQVDALENEVRQIIMELIGDESISKRFGNQPPSIYNRAYYMLMGVNESSSTPPATFEEQYVIIAEVLEPLLQRLRKIAHEDLKNLEDQMEVLRAPWTPGRIPDWKKN